MTAWSLSTTAATGLLATVTQAAGGAGRRNVLRGFSGSMVSSLAQNALTVLIRDGATGVGAILYRVRLSNLITEFGASVFGQSEVFLIGSVNTEMTIEFNVSSANISETVGAFGIVI